MEKGRSKSFCRSTKKQKTRKNTSKNKQKHSNKKSPHKSRVSKDKTPRKKLSHNQQFSPSINQPAQSEDKGLISKTLISNKKYKHNNEDYVKFLDVGKQFLRDGLYSSALDCLQRAILLQPNQFQAHYLLGVTLLVDQQLQQAEQCFVRLIGHPQPKKNVFLLLAVCLKKQCRIDYLDQLLSQCIRRYPKYYEAYAYRAKIRIKLKNLQLALQDFQTAIKINPQNTMGYIGKGDVLRLMGQQQEAFQNFKKVAGPNPSQSLLLKQALCKIQLQQFGDALSLVQQSLSKNSQNSQALFLKGLVFQRNKQFSLAITYYEQAILQFTNKKAVAKSFYQIIKINIEQKDYYQAINTAQRVYLYNIEQKTLSKFIFFLDAVYLLRKKQTAASIAHLQQFQQRFKPGQFLRPLVANFRACAYMSLSDYQQAFQQLTILQSQHYLDSQSHYNLLICTGVIASNNYKYQQAVTAFASAMSKAPTRHQPAFYMAMTLIKYSCKHFAPTDVEKKEKYMKAAFNYIQKALKITPNHYALLYHRAVFLFYQGDLPAALRDASQSIKHASNQQQPVAKILYLRGLICSSLNNISKAIQEFTNVITQDRRKQFPQAYLNRAKCLLFYGDKQAALADLQTYISNNPSDPAIHQWTGIVFYHFKSYQESIRAYSNTINIRKNKQVLKLRADGYLATKQIKSCIDDLKLIINLQPSSQTKFDLIILQAIKASLVSDKQHFQNAVQLLQKAKKQTSRGIYFSSKDISFYQGIFLFFLCQIDTACEYIKKAKYYKVQSDHSSQIKIAETCYNLAIALIVKGDIFQAIKQLEQASHYTNRSDLQQIKFLIEKLTDDSQTGQNQDQIEIDIFKRNNKLSNVYPLIPLPIKGHVLAKFSFCLPLPQPITIAPQFQFSKLFQTMNTSIVEPIPQLPWVNKSRQGIVTFTDQILPDAMQITFTTDQEQQQIKQSDLYQDQLNQGHLASSSQIGQADVKVPPRRDVKDFLRLDDSVNQRLNRLLHN